MCGMISIFSALFIVCIVMNHGFVNAMPQTPHNSLMRTMILGIQTLGDQISPLLRPTVPESHPRAVACVLDEGEFANISFAGDEECNFPESDPVGSVGNASVGSSSSIQKVSQPVTTARTLHSVSSWHNDIAVDMIKNMYYGRLYRYLRENAKVNRRADWLEGSLASWEQSYSCFNVPPAYLFFIEIEIERLSKTLAGMNFGLQKEEIFSLAVHIVRFLLFVQMDVSTHLITLRTPLGEAVARTSNVYAQFKRYILRLLLHYRVSMQSVRVIDVIHHLNAVSRDSYNGTYNKAPEKNNLPTSWFCSYRGVFSCVWVERAFKDANSPFGDYHMPCKAGEIPAKVLEDLYAVKQRIVRILLGEYALSSQKFLSRDCSVDEFLQLVNEFGTEWNDYLRTHWKSAGILFERLCAHRH